MIFLAILLQSISPASAGPGPHVLPDAVPTLQGSGEISMSVDGTAYVGVSSTVRARLAATDRIRLDTALVGFQGFGGTGWDLPGYLGARYRIHESEALSVASFVGMAWSYSPKQTIKHKALPVVVPAAFDLFPGVGIALEGGSRRIRMDLAAAAASSLDLERPIVVAEAGVTLNLTDADSLRVGGLAMMDELLPAPSISYRHAWDRVYVGAQGGFTPVPGIGVSAGMIW